MKAVLPGAIRLILSGAIVYAVWCEAGPFTALAIALMAINAEVSALLFREARATLIRVLAILEKLTRGPASEPTTCPRHGYVLPCFCAPEVKP